MRFHGPCAKPYYSLIHATPLYHANNLTPLPTPVEVVELKGKRGRPRKYPLPDPNAPKRKPGRGKDSRNTYKRLAKSEKAAMSRKEH
ncbi:hypothetical protein EJ02DRAFT_114055 [Clathrospora elynae]|uniref:Uncharacterized protein n=1 Tax=Clathrospora elynae TaxID=706981 RepID=A0A6A5SZV3_9PLEO|nr:hypothetical protein EJ02DRAFT_114055 [Clathrospora elynae]